MTTNDIHYVYNQEAIDFVTVAAQICLFLEHLEQVDKRDFLEKTGKLLPLLYLKTRMLNLPEQEMEGYPQRFVTEEDYNYVQCAVAGLLSDDDAYLEVFVEDMRYSDEPVTAYVSENIADIYQEIKDLAANYQTENESVMNDALLACLEAFREHWGQKLLNAMRALHVLWLDADAATEEHDEQCKCGHHHHDEHCSDDEHCHCGHHHC
ncbi:MAG: DUF5063 domain-containing protein [Paludibacter sp.]|nr:DUF5063 domain-containing protein [Bacteroidales bacterium]MCM1069228.1 DUF5063 domain-containing protein [Prevotella sp.]MCM1354352.1 DUF5063 domain-containing protein [Bacteroides sp.]MCM1443188.1 DUF5063 domain-containing protein [Muribaculum sp.]MCM1481783.1 DUF5063 domain-containing protein [Paludibacter sp.]